MSLILYFFFFFSAFAASYKKRVILKSRVLQQPKAEVQYKLNNAPTPQVWRMQNDSKRVQE